MEDNEKFRDFEIQDPEEGASPDVTYGGEVDLWNPVPGALSTPERRLLDSTTGSCQNLDLADPRKDTMSIPSIRVFLHQQSPVKVGLKNCDIQDPNNQVVSSAREIQVWMQVRLAFWTMGLATVWALCGLIFFMATGNFWLLTTSGWIILPLRVILNHYFGTPKSRRGRRYRVQY